MKNLYLLLVTVFIAFSCQDITSESVTPEPYTHPDWIKLEIPNGREAYGVAGNLDNVLLVTTLTKAYYTTDKGKTWQESKDFQGPRNILFTRNDTTFVFNGSAYDKAANSINYTPDYFTPDYGKTWFYYPQFSNKEFTITLGQVSSLAGITYQLKNNTTPIHAGATNTAYVNPSDIIKKHPSGQENLAIPFKHLLHNLHLDSRNRLYVCAANDTYQPETNTLNSPAETAPAIVYVSRKPLP